MGNPGIRRQNLWDVNMIGCFMVESDVPIT
jgi:hypothetical protein